MTSNATNVLRSSHRQRFNIPCRVFVAAVLSLSLIIAILIAPKGAEAKTAEYTSFDVALDLGSDGVFHVSETQHVAFAGGSFSLGHREIPLARTEGINNIRVSEIDASGRTRVFSLTDLNGLSDATETYAVQTMSSNVTIWWAFDPVEGAGDRTFVVQYDVLGALRYYPDENPANQQIWWTAIGKELSDETPVQSATVTITLPVAVSLNQVVLGQDGKDDPTTHSSDGKVFTWTSGDIGRGDDLTVRMQFPPIVQGISPPAWQASDDAQRAKDAKSDSRQAVIHLMLLGAGLILIAGGGTSLYGLWYMRGRDPHAGLVAEFLPTPPDDLPPGVVGALVDERADEQDVVASVIDLGRRGIIRISDTGSQGPLSRPTGADYLFEFVDPSAHLNSFERPLVAAMFGSAPKSGAKVRLAETRQAVRRAYPEAKQALDQELVTRGLFSRSPESTRGGWRKTGKIIAVIAILAGAIGIALEGWWAVFPAIVALALSGVVYFVGRSMPKKTIAGAEAAAKWRAFRRYLDDIENYERVAETQQIFDRFLPYAIAFGIESGWVKKFAAVSVPSTGWIPGAAGDILSVPGHRRTTTWIGPTSIGGTDGGVDLPDINLPKVPSMQKLSNDASSGLQSTSSGFSGLLSVAGAIFEILSAFSGGGGSGGSSGGGGGGFK